MTSRLTTPCLAAMLPILAVSLAAASLDDGAAHVLEEPPDQDRTFIDALLDTLFVIGSINDEELLHPIRIAAGDDRIYVFDGGDDAVKAYGESGELLWKVGRTGGGPGEFRRVRSIASTIEGGVVLVDQTNVRLTEVSAEGEILREVPLRPIEGTPQQVIQIAPDTFLIWTLTRRNEPLTLVTSSGAVVARADVPFAVGPRVPYLGSQAHIANDMRRPERWVYAFSFVDKWRILDGLQPASPEYTFVVPFPLPDVVFEDRGQRGLDARVGPAPRGAYDAAMVGNTVFVLSVDTRRERRRVIDIYEHGAGRYLGSIRLPEPVGGLAVRPGRMTLLVTDPYPRVISVRYDLRGSR